jgi:hypothetical protein
MTTRKFIGPLGGMWIFDTDSLYPEVGEYRGKDRLDRTGIQAWCTLSRVLDMVEKGDVKEINADPDLEMDIGL